MKLYVDAPPKISKGIHRVKDALIAHKPMGTTVVSDLAEADLVVFHVVGVQNFDDVDIGMRIAECVERGQRYAMIQYCLTTTENGGDPVFWGPLWNGATCLWSYYDIDAHLGKFGYSTALDNFYHAPLGADPTVFTYNPNVPKLFTIGTSGFVAETEGIIECARAAKATRNWMFHLGPDHRLGQHVAVQHGLTDAQVARRWAECDYVAGLRRVEGFELPAVEALFCGSRPILFDAPHYRQWFDGLGVFIPESDPATVTEALIDVFERGRQPLAPLDIAEAHARFGWAKLVAGFWERAL